MTMEEQIAALKAEKQALEAKNAELTAAIVCKDAALDKIETEKLVDDAIAAKKLLPAQRETAVFMAKQGKDVFEKFVAATAVTDITKTKTIHETESAFDDPKKEYQELIRNPGKAQKMKKDNPEKFDALRNAALYGGKE